MADEEQVSAGGAAPAGPGQGQGQQAPGSAPEAAALPVPEAEAYVSVPAGRAEAADGNHHTSLAAYPAVPATKGQMQQQQPQAAVKVILPDARPGPA